MGTVIKYKWIIILALSSITFFSSFLPIISLASPKHVKLSPSIQIFPAQREIPTMALKVIGPFLNGSLVLNNNDLAKAPKILEIDDQHLLVGQCFRFFSVMCDVKLGDRYGVYKPGPDLIDPRTKVCLGKEAILLGTARVIQLGCADQASTLVLEEALEEIKIGDKLLPFQAITHTPCFYLHAPETIACGVIVAVLGGEGTQIGQYNVVAITGGRDQGREPGEILAIYQTKNDEPSRIRALYCFRKLFCENTHKIQFLPQKVGELMVFKTFEKVSFGLVTNSLRPIYLQDEVKRP